MNNSNINTEKNIHLLLELYSYLKLEKIKNVRKS